MDAPWWRWVAAVVFAMLLVAPAAAAEGALVEVFVREDCPHCEHAKAYLADLSARRPDVRLVYRDVIRDPGARERLRALAAEAGVEVVGVPAFHVGGELLVGFAGPETSGRALERLLDAAAPPARDRVDVPLFGELRLESLGLPLFTVLLGLVDGFNPCAMWVLLFILSLLVNLRDRRRMLLIAGTFVAVSGLVYFAFMAAWLNLFQALGVSRGVQIALGAIALLVGAVNVKDFFAFGTGPSLSIPKAAKPTLYRRARRVLTAENLPAALGAVVVLALLVNLVELLCTAGLPAVYTQILAGHELSPWGYYGYLALYNAAYVLDDGVMVFAAVVSLTHRPLQEKAGRRLKLLGGVVMLALGALLILKPGWLSW
jgi:glutaredoxin